MKQLFQPDGIAVVGASSNPGKAGFVAIRNMREKGYPGKVYPVNPKETEILGYPCSPSLAEVEGHVDLVVLIMPSRMIYSVMDDLDRRMKEKGLKVYKPDLDAFRAHVQKEYLASKFAKDWPAGMVDKINAIK